MPTIYPHRGSSHVYYREIAAFKDIGIGYTLCATFPKNWVEALTTQFNGECWAMVLCRGDGVIEVLPAKERDIRKELGKSFKSKGIM